MSSRADGPPLLEARVGAARVWCSGRADGNIGDHVGDDPAVVARNRAALASRVSPADSQSLTWVRQVHGADVLVATGMPTNNAPEADAIVTAVRGLPLAIVTADCAPLVIASDNAVGVVHAGHPGLAAGVIEAAVASLRELGSGDVRALLGPCIRPGQYEFGPDDLARFVSRFGPSVQSFTTSGRPALDIPAAIRIVLDGIGVTELDDCGICTSASADYFSYRRDGVTGRQATIAELL